MKSDRVCRLWYREPNRGECVCAVNVRQAETVLGILEQDTNNRRNCSRALQNCLFALRTSGQLKPSTNINVRRVTSNGIVAEVKTPLYWRVCVWLMFMCITDDHSARRIVISRLRDFISGLDVSDIDPFAKSQIVLDHTNAPHGNC